MHSRFSLVSNKKVHEEKRNSHETRTVRSLQSNPNSNQNHIASISELEVALFGKGEYYNTISWAIFLCVYWCAIVLLALKKHSILFLFYNIFLYFATS